MTKLVLNVGDTVRNINENSLRKGWVGVVTSDRGTLGYKVSFQNSEVQYYSKTHAHKYLEKLVSAPVDYASLEERILAQHGEFIISQTDLQKLKEFYGMFYGAAQPRQGTQRRVLKKVRRNVISGKTQESMVKELGVSRGVQQFNTRCLGKSTGQALYVIGCAMMNPGTEVRISKVDHAKANDLCTTSWTTLDKHFRSLVQKHIGDMKGFTFTDTHLVFNPIVTEETYVEI